jgi:hypothetical protein
LFDPAGEFEFPSADVPTIPRESPITELGAGPSDELKAAVSAHPKLFGSEGELTKSKESGNAPDSFTFKLST